MLVQSTRQPALPHRRWDKPRFETVSGTPLMRERMQATTFATLRDLVLHHAAGRGWTTQRHIAVICGLDESALSRFLNGEQDLGARRTHAIFQAVGIPVVQYDLAYTLLGRAQELAQVGKQYRAHRQPGGGQEGGRAAIGRGSTGPAMHADRRTLSPSELFDSFAGDIPAAVAIAHFAMHQYRGEEIAQFFAEHAAIGSRREREDA